MVDDAKRCGICCPDHQGRLVVRKRSRQKKPFGESNFNRLLRNYKKKAQERGLVFELSKEEFKDLVNNFCHYCSGLPTQIVHEKNSNGAFFYNGIDRVDNNRGYTKDNCVTCCGTCNRMKFKHDKSKFLNHVSQIHHNKKTTNRFIVTGGAGFIGSSIVEKLLSDKNHVFVLDNFSTGLLAHLPDHENLTILNVDIGDWNSLSQVFDQLSNIDTVFHCAAQAGIMPSILNPITAQRSNIDGTFNILQMMRILHIPRIIYSASSSRYGTSENFPISENEPISLLNPYSLSKYVAEEYCNTWSKQYGLTCISLIYFNVYGPKERLVGDYATVIGKFHRQALQEKTDLTIVGDGENKRDFTYIDDVVSANLLAQKKLTQHGEKLSGRKYNIGTGVNYSINELAKKIIDNLSDVAPWLSQTTVSPRPSEARETLANNTLAKRDLGWEAKVSLDEGLLLEKQYYCGLYS